jgi:hypothetical protein
MKTVIERPRAPGRATWVVGVLVGVSLLVGGFALGRRVFPQAPMVEELPPRPQPKWRSDLEPDEPAVPPIAPPALGPTAAETAKAKGKPLAGRPPKKGGKGKVRFITAHPAEVFIGKRRLGLSNELLVMPSGRHRVELVVPGGEKSATIEVDVVAGSSSDLRVTLEGAR